MISSYDTKDPSGSTQLSTFFSWAAEKLKSPSCLLQLCLLRWSFLQAYPPLHRHWGLEFPKTCSEDAFSSLSALFQFSSVTRSCLTFCKPMNRSMPGLPVHHQLPEFTQTHVHQVSDAIQPSHPLLSPSPPAPNPSQHQGLFQWVNSSHGGQSIGVSALVSVLPMNTQDWCPLGWTGVL